jgi:type IV pilus assembly protein PilQ
MKRNLIYCLILYLTVIGLWGCATTARTQQATESQERTAITGIEIKDNMVIIRASSPFIYTIYRPGDPYKLIVDIPDTSIGGLSSRILSKSAGITEIIPSQIESPSLMTRLEMILQTPAVVEQEYKNNTLTLTLKEQSPQEIPAGLYTVTDEKEVPQASAPPVQKPLPKATEISSISFEQKIETIDLLIKGNGSMIPNIFPLDDRIIIDVPDVVINTTVPLEVTSPVTGIRSDQQDNKVRLVVDMREQTNFDVTAIGDSIVIAFQRPAGERPVASSLTGMLAEDADKEPFEADTEEEGEEPAALEEGKYTGKKISLDFQDADIVPIFRLLADISGYNIVVSPEVKGKLTMKLINVPWDQALDLILKTFSLGKSVEGNIIRIAPYQIFAKEREEAVKAQEAGIKAEPLLTKIFPISYADVKVVQASVKSSKILTNRGSTSIDIRTSTMLVKDVASVFLEIEKLLATLDTPTPQVLIEARIVEVNTANVVDLGIQWGGFLIGSDGLSQIGGFSGLGTGPFTGHNFIVDFPGGGTAGGGTGFTFGMLNPAKSMGLDVQLSAYETLGKLKIISNPRIITLDNKEAKILQGKSIPVRKLTTEGTISTEFKDVTLELTVQPHIAPDDTISMIVSIKKEELDPTVPSIEGVPGTDKKEAKTSVIIANGETVVIGGVYKITNTTSEQGVPGLMKIPILGWLFKKKSIDTQTNELLIFITPRIVEQL